MGIKSLTKLIKQKAPDSITTSQYHKLSGKRIAIDASLYIYQCLMNVRGKNGNHILQMIIIKLQVILQVYFIKVCKLFIITILNSIYTSLMVNLQMKNMKLLNYVKNGQKLQKQN